MRATDRPRRLNTIAVIGTFCVAVIASGVTYAATSGSSAVKACANSKGVLRLLDAHGRCPKHYSKISLNQRGPRGRAGARGPAGPGATSLSVGSTVGLVTKESKPIGGTTLTVEVLCNPANEESQVYVNLDAAGPAFSFEGTASTDGTGSILYEDPAGGSAVVQTLGSTVHQYNALQPGDAHSVEFTSTGKTLQADMLFAQGSKMFSVKLAAFEASDFSSCWAHAMVTPAG